MFVISLLLTSCLSITKIGRITMEGEDVVNAYKSSHPEDVNKPVYWLYYNYLVHILGYDNGFVHVRVRTEDCWIYNNTVEEYTMTTEILQQTNLYSSADRGSTILQLLYPNTKVNVIDFNVGQFMEISYLYYGQEKRGFIIQSSTKYYNDTYGGKNYGERAISLVREKLGCEYVWAMQGPDTFDCSGLMQWAYNVLDVYIPRNADQQSEFGKKLTDKKDLLPGDLVTFYTVSSRPNDVTHVGMYAGNGKFIHASSAYGKVVEMDLDTYPYKIASMNRCW